MLDTRRLHVCLPEEKSIAWCYNIDKMLEIERKSFNDMDILIGRLTHLSVIIYQVKHFLRRLRKPTEISKNRQDTFITKRYATDLRLHLKVLKYARKGSA